MADGRWQMTDDGWRMADGGWRMADGRWQMADGRWQMADCRLVPTCVIAGLLRAIAEEPKKLTKEAPGSRLQAPARRPAQAGRLAFGERVSPLDREGIAKRIVEFAACQHQVCQLGWGRVGDSPR